MNLISFVVQGIPAPKGSMQSIGRGRMIHDNPATVAWSQAVTLAAIQKAPPVPLEGPVCVCIEFFFPFLKKHLKKDGTRKFPDITPWDDGDYDVDKLARCVLDALQNAGVYKNDKQVARLICEKHLYEKPYAAIKILPLMQEDVLPFEEE